MESHLVPPSDLDIQIDPTSRTKPKILFRLNDWQYLERSVHRLIAAWGRLFAEWDDKSAIHRHVWEAAECVRRLRERISEFVGGKPDAPVSTRLEKLANTALLAPSFEDAVSGIYEILNPALVGSYREYMARAHPVHDAPTLQTLHAVCTAKEQHWTWLRDYRRRHPHEVNPAYRSVLERELAACEHLLKPLPIDGEPARPVGAETDFRLPRFSARPENSRSAHDFMPYVSVDFSTSIEARRLFWAYGYMLEKNLPDDQLRWIYWGGMFMPWEFLHNISRHLWDESRHGDSGYSRLLDWGITLDEVGFPPYATLDEKKDAGEPMSPGDLYEEIFFIGMVAETGHFEVKNEAYADFRDGGDLESAEMMLFDVIDETTHVQYAHRIRSERRRKNHQQRKGCRRLSANGTHS